jgi:hypothetical protein
MSHNPDEIGLIVLAYIVVIPLILFLVSRR